MGLFMVLPGALKGFLGKIILTKNMSFKTDPYPVLSPNLKPDLGKGENLNYLSPPFLIACPPFLGGSKWGRLEGAVFPG
jgi:hypothetical protein